MPDKAKIIPHADVPRPYGKDLIKLPPTKMTFACLTPSGSHWMPHRARLICSRNHRSLNLTFFCIPALRGWSSQGAFECLHILYTYCKKAIFCGEKSGYFVKNANLNVRKLPFFSQGSKRAFFVKKSIYPGSANFCIYNKGCLVMMLLTTRLYMFSIFGEWAKNVPLRKAS